MGNIKCQVKEHEVKYIVWAMGNQDSEGYQTSIKHDSTECNLCFSHLFPHQYAVCGSHSVVSNSFQSHGLQPTRLLCPRNSPGENTGVGSHFLPQGIFLTQGSAPGLLHCRRILYHLSREGSPSVCCIQHIIDPQ